MTVAADNIAVYADTTGALIKDSGTPISALNLFQSVSSKTGTYSVVQADKQSTIRLGGSSFYTVTLPNPAVGFSNFSCALVNADTGRAKWIVVTGGTNFYLWPGQTVLMVNDGTAWQPIGRGQRWRITGAVTINVDPLNGSDTDGVADGLGTSGGAFRSIDHALYALGNFIDFTSLPQALVTILLASGATDTTPIHWAPHSKLGAQGGASILIDLNGGILSTPSTGIAVFYTDAVQIRNGTIRATTGGACVSAGLGGRIELLDGLTLGPVVSGNSIIAVSDGGRVQLNNNFTVAGPNTGCYLFNFGDDGRIDTSGSTPLCTFSGAQAFTSLIIGLAGDFICPGLTYTAGANTVTGAMYQLTQRCRYYDAGNLASFRSTQSGMTNAYDEPWTSFTPTVTPGGGAFNNVTATGRYRFFGSTAYVQYKIVFTDIGTATTGVSVATPPIGGNPGGPQNDTVISGLDPVIGTVSGQCAAHSGSFTLFGPTGSLTSMMVNGHTTYLSGTFEIAGQ